MRRLTVAVLVVVACAGCGGTSGTGGGSTPGTANPPATSSTSPVPVDPGVVVRVGKGPVGLAVDEDQNAWVALAGDNRVSRIRGGKVDVDVTGVDVPLRLAAAGGVVWATAFGTGELVRIETRSAALTTRTQVGKGAEGVTVGLGSVWVVAQDAGALVRVDPDTSKVSGTADIGVGARLVTTGGGAVWVSHFANGTVLRVDPATLAVSTSPHICNGPQGIVATADAVWVACTTDNIVVRLDPATWAVTARVTTPTAPDDLAAGPDGRIRLVTQQGPTLAILDPATNVLVSQQALGTLPQLYDQANVAVAVTTHGTWVSAFSADEVHQLAAG